MSPVELVIAHNPDPDSRLPYVIWVPYRDGLVFRAGGTWPRTKAVYCHPLTHWPDGAEVIERVPVRSCARRGPRSTYTADTAGRTPPPPRGSAGNAEIRAWARSRGLAVGDRGCIPAHIRDAYLAAHPHESTEG
jgi:hypothetical protein